MLRKRNIGRWLELTIVFGVYFITARIGLSLDAVNHFATLVWPPAGIALAAILIYGYRLWPAVALAAFLVNWVTGAPILVALGIGCGNAMEAIIGAYAIKRFTSFQFTFERINDVFGLVIFAGLVSTAIGATVGTTSLLLGSTIRSGQYGGTWLAWWLGDMLGDLVIATLVLVWLAGANLKFNIKPMRLLEAALSGLLLVIAVLYVFRGFPVLGIENFSFTYVIFPPLAWIALRFGQRGTTLATFLVALIAIWCTVDGYGPFATNSPGHGLLVLQSFIGITTVTFMSMSAVVAQQELAQKRQQQLLRRASRLIKQRARLVSLNQAKDEFVAIASHQLRTPATAVKQYLSLLLDGYSEPITKEQRSFLEKAYESNDRQLQIVDDLLIVAQLDLDKMKLRRRKQDITRTVQEAVSALSLVFKDRQQHAVVISPKNPVMASVDSVQFSTVIENLLENASNYSPKGTAITLTISKRKAGIQVTVKDEGVGIAQDDFPRLFQKFSRIRNDLSNSVNGTGLGLYLSQKIIELHGGRITVRSTPKKGSAFMINIPG